MAWDEATKAEVVALYTEANPTPETSTELIKEIAEKVKQSPNGVRMVLVKEGVYVKQDKPASSSKKTEEAGEGTKRVSKETQINALRTAIQAKGAEVDEEILAKLTGKAAAYFTLVLGS